MVMNTKGEPDEKRQPGLYRCGSNNSLHNTANSYTGTDEEDSDERSSSGHAHYRERRREAHTQAEQKRRDAIKKGYDSLQNLVPTCQQQDAVSGYKMSKATVLNRSIDYIQFLTQQKKKLEEDLSALRKEKTALAIMKQNYEDIVKAHQSRPPPVAAQVPDELKFQVLRSILEALYASFDEKISVENFSELSASVFKWLEEYCKPQALRQLVLSELQKAIPPAPPISPVHHQHMDHPRNLIPLLCRQFYQLGWVTGTGGGISVRDGSHIYIAPSGVQKERIQPEDLFVIDLESEKDVSVPPPEKQLKRSQCTPLFMAAYQSSVLATLLWPGDEFTITHVEMIKGIRNGATGKALTYLDTLHVPIIENTPEEADLKDRLWQTIEDNPETCAVLVRRHGFYCWGNTWEQAKAMCECYDYLFSLGVEMKRLGLDPMSKPASMVN
ncbi:unnamed protein product [Cyprideis torosa]|uniref:Probable methylthioribulose-1-phosphate dehydratase n=1 Tax=Cyprideis torosa TaxID=163714 RepID=A0A7R8WAC6_9CRUS|nr:unnamed protein product [Cyprideis torosa]CAG0890792.1 unnamed protein product [Cyprideis torosa]